MANDTTITVRGWVGSEPKLYSGTHDGENSRGSVSTTLMSLGVTPRIFNRRTERFENGQTAWYSIRCFGQLAQNVAHSVHKGAPILVRGRLSTRSYTDKNDVQRVNQVIYADSVAIDLNTCTATYTRGVPSYVLPKGSDTHDVWEHHENRMMVDDSCKKEHVNTEIGSEPSEDPAGVLANV